MEEKEEVYKTSESDTDGDKAQHTHEVFADLGNAIQQLRQYYDLTLEEAATRTRMTPNKLAAIERGSMYNNINKTARIVEALGGRLAIVPEENADDPHCQFIEFEK